MREIYFSDKEFKRRRRIFKLKIYGYLIVFFILAGGIGYVVIYSSLLQIKEITILRTSDVQNIDNNLGTSDVQKLRDNLKDFFANQSTATNFLGPDNILIWRKEKISEFLKDHPLIAELTIKKDYIKRQIEINVKERKKFGIWCLQAQNYAEQTQNNAENFPRESAPNLRESAFCWWFDKNSILFQEAPIAEGSLIKKVADFSGRQIKIGDLILEQPFAANLIKIFEIAEKINLNIQSLKLENLQLQEVVAESSGEGPKIYFSLKFDPNFNLAALQSFKELAWEKIDYIDLRVENRAYYKMK